MFVSYSIAVLMSFAAMPFVSASTSVIMDGDEGMGIESVEKQTVDAKPGPVREDPGMEKKETVGGGVGKAVGNGNPVEPKGGVSFEWATFARPLGEFLKGTLEKIKGVFP
jgi:hypothetical protein